MEEEEDARPEPDAGGSAVGLFLALYLLLLAFFILLNTISTFEEIKARAVKESLSSAFASVMPPTTAQESTSSREGPILAAQEFQEQIAELFETDIKIVRIEVMQPGKLMEIIVPVDLLFEPDDARILEEKNDFMVRMARSLRLTKPGMRYEVEMQIGMDTDRRGLLTLQQTLPMARGGAFARGLIDRGAPVDSVYVGVAPGTDPEMVTFRFYWDTFAEETSETSGVSNRPALFSAHRILSGYTG